MTLREKAFEILQDTQGHDADRKVDIIAKALLAQIEECAKVCEAYNQPDRLRAKMTTQSKLSVEIAANVLSMCCVELADVIRNLGREKA